MHAPHLMHLSMSENSLPKMRLLPLSRKTTYISSGLFFAFPGPATKSVYTVLFCAVALRPSRLRNTASSRAEGITFSNPTRAMCVFAPAIEKRALPSFVASTRAPSFASA